MTLLNWHLHKFFKACLLVMMLWIIPLVLNKYADQSFPYISKDEILLKLVGHININTSERDIKMCPLISPFLIGMDYDIQKHLKEITLLDSSLTSLKRFNTNLGGSWHPLSCHSRYQVILILPYRNRVEHLAKFLSYMHPFLQRQQIFYRIVVVEQEEGKPFNRAKLFNIGYIETKNISSPRTCFVFHDLDLIPENDHNIYACTLEPRHMPTAIDTFRYNLLYRNLLGGAVAMFGLQFEIVNGFSNNFNGWGAEDDDFASRLEKNGLTFVRFDPKIASYIMLPHIKEVPSSNRFDKLKGKELNQFKDGISSVTYTIKAKKFFPLYTYILASW